MPGVWDINQPEAMSDSTPNEMKQDCDNKRACMEMLQLIIDGEATELQKEDFINNHLDHCLPCFNTYNLEIGLRQLLKNKCQCEAPSDVIEAIKSRIANNLAT